MSSVEIEDSDNDDIFGEMSEIESIDDELEIEKEVELGIDEPLVQDDPEYERYLEEQIIVEEEPIIEEIAYEEDINEKKYAKGVKNFKDALMSAYAANNISTDDYFKELLELELYEKSIQKSKVVSNEGIILIQELEQERKKELEKYLTGKISKFDYDKFYINSLRIEKQIIKDHEQTTKKEKKERFDLTSPLISVQDKLDYLIKQENKTINKLAKKYSLILPKEPDPILANSPDQSVRDKYIKDLTEYQDARNYIMKTYLEGYKLKKLNISTPSKFSYEIETPVIVQLNRLKKREPQKSLISQGDILEQENQKYLKKLLNSLPKEELINCIKKNNLFTTEFSYIQQLKDKKVPIFKFTQFPTDQNELDKLIDKEIIGQYSVRRNMLNTQSKTFSEDSTQSIALENLPNSNLAAKVPFQGESIIKTGKIIPLKLKKELKLVGTEDDLIKNFEPIVPISDPLYEEIKRKGQLKDRIAYVYELHFEVPGYEKEGLYVTKRYTDFIEYLKDLKLKLETNLLTLETKKLTADTEIESINYSTSISILKSKINKITYYLNESIDIDLANIDVKEEQTRLKIQNKINKEREEGLNKLKNLLLVYTPDALNKAESLEEQIYNSSAKLTVDMGTDILTFYIEDYKFLINKVIFLFKQYPEILQDYINGNILPKILIDYEIPLIEPEDYTKSEEFKILRSDLKLNYLIEWNPPSDYYIKYKEIIDSIDFDSITDKNIIDYISDILKQNGISLTLYEIKQLIEEKNEYEYYTNAKQEVIAITQIPKFYTPELWKYKQLRKYRYRLPSQRIFRISNIKQRIENFENFKNIFNICRFKNIETLAYLTENKIYSISKTDIEYKQNIKKIINNYKSFCKYLNEYLTETGEKEQFDVINQIILITEFFYKNNNIGLLNKEKIIKIFESLNKPNVELERVLGVLTEEELKSYQKLLIQSGDVNPDIKRRFKLLKSVSTLIEALEKSKNKLYEEEINTYVKPHLSVKPPETGDNFFYYNGNYVIGGNFPDFKNSNGEDNYSIDDLDELIDMFNVNNLTKDSNKLQKYIEIMNKINQLKSMFNFIDKKPLKATKELEYIVYSKPKILLEYTLRPRNGVPTPGEVYYTSTSIINEYKKQYPTNRDYFEREYGVPYKYENTIPVYEASLKDMKGVLIEGPAIFRTKEEDPIATASTSPYHIFVEYKDTYGNIVYFREGVSRKNIIKVDKDKVDTCNRFKRKIDCNNPNSFSLDSRKCVFNDATNKCVSSLFENIIITDKDIWEYIPEDEEFKLIWLDALTQSKKFILQETESKNLGDIGINNLIKDQSIRLYKFKKELESRQKIKKIDTPTSLSFSEEAIELLERLEKPRKKSITNLSDYMTISIKYTETELADRILTEHELKKFKKFKLPDYGEVDILKIEYYPDISNYKVLIRNSKGEYLIPIGYFKTKETTPTITTKTKFVYISKDDYNFMMNPPKEFKWILKETKFDFEKYINDVELEFEESIVNYVDTTIIKPSETFNDVELIVKKDIEDAIIKLAFSTYIKENEVLILEEKFNATDDAIKLALDEDVSLFSSYFEYKYTEINTNDVIEYLKSLVPNVTTIEQDTIFKLDKAINEENKKDILKLIEVVEKLDIDTELVNKGIAKIKEIEAKEEEFNLKASKKQTKKPDEKTIKIVKETTKKSSQESVDIGKKFKMKSVIDSDFD